MSSNIEKAKTGRRLAEKYWNELRAAFGDDEMRIGHVIGELQDRNIKLHIKLTKRADQETQESRR